MDEIPEWFIGARLNYAENIFSKYCDDKLAIIATGEFNQEYELTYKQLAEKVRLCAGAMKKMGVQKSDRVATYIPNCIEAVIVFLAATSLGAIYSSTSPDFGTTGVLDRFTQIRPKLLFSVNAVVYNGKTYDHLSKLKAVTDKLDMVEKVVVIPFVEQHSMEFDENWLNFNDFMQLDMAYELCFERVPFNHPLYILFSSGTTGKPKCITHCVGGALIQHLKEHKLHGDMKREDVFFQYTTTGWMMWNWLVSGLTVGCTIFLYDGSPFKPNPEILWELAERFKFTRFGTSAKYLQSMEQMSIIPAGKYNLDNLKDIYSTGSPLKPESFDFVYNHIKKDVCLGSITGGTDIVSLFAGHNRNLPVYRGEIQCVCLGMAVECWVDGKKTESSSGDLVCTRPFPCMPVYFWGDEKNEKYRDAYFSTYPGVWYHGDYVYINPKTGGVIMLGRSDGTLKPAGVRFGSAELYNVLDTFKDNIIEDSLAVGQKRPQDDDERVILFIKMVPGKQFDEELVKKLKVHIRKELSPRHVPAFIIPIDDIPYTINGKKVEVAVKKIVSGIKLTSSSSSTLANPESLKLYENITEIN